MGQAVSEGEDFFFPLVFVLPAAADQAIPGSDSLGTLQSLFPKTFISLTPLENFKWESQFVACFVGTFVLANC